MSMHHLALMLGPACEAAAGLMLAAREERELQRRGCTPMQQLLRVRGCGRQASMLRVSTLSLHFYHQAAGKLSAM